MAQEVVVTETPSELPTEGNRIILDATAGKEKIQIIDQAGNEIVMNAVMDQQYVKIFSPKHETKFILGDVKRAADHSKGAGDYINRVVGGPHSWVAWAMEDDIGVYVYTKGQIKIKAKNNYSKWVEGQYNQHVLGVYTSTVTGMYNSMLLGAKTDITVGLKLAIELGVKHQIGKLKEIVTLLAGREEVSSGPIQTTAPRVETTSPRILIDTLDWKLRSPAGKAELFAGVLKIKGIV
jgi:hypothetical protein